MELDNLKQAWKTLDSSSPAADRDSILGMLQKKSQRPIARIRRNLRYEMWAIVLLYTATILYYFLANHGKFWGVAVLLLAIGSLFMIYYYLKNKLLNEMECVACEVRSNLERQVRMLEKYLRIYFIAGNLLTPISYITAGIVVIEQSPGITAISTNFLLLFFLGCAAVTILVYFLNRWYLNKLYGQHIIRLKALLEELQS